MAFNPKKVQEFCMSQNRFDLWLNYLSSIDCSPIKSNKKKVKTTEIRLDEDKNPFNFFKSIEEVDAKLGSKFNRNFCIAEMPLKCWFQDKSNGKLYKVIRFDNEAQEMVCICGTTGKEARLDASDNAYYIGAEKKLFSTWANRCVDDIVEPTKSYKQVQRLLIQLDDGKIIDIPKDHLTKSNILPPPPPEPFEINHLDMVLHVNSKQPYIEASLRNLYEYPWWEELEDQTVSVEILNRPVIVSGIPIKNTIKFKDGETYTTANNENYTVSEFLNALAHHEKSFRSKQENYFLDEMDTHHVIFGGVETDINTNETQVYWDS